jgi:hypothetical protein
MKWLSGLPFVSQHCARHMNLKVIEIAWSIEIGGKLTRNEEWKKTECRQKGRRVIRSKDRPWNSAAESSEDAGDRGKGNVQMTFAASPPECTFTTNNQNPTCIQHDRSSATHADVAWHKTGVWFVWNITSYYISIFISLAFMELYFNK